MKRIPHRELRNNSAEVLRAVQAGETFEVTNNGEVVAVLAPPNAITLQGVRFRPPLERGRFADLPLTTCALSTQQVLDELREER